MSTNRVVTAEPSTTAAAPSTDGRRLLCIVGALLTVALLAPSAALLAARVRGLLALEDGSAPACEGAAVVEVVPDRRVAIEHAIRAAAEHPGGVVALLGKGHETGQEIQGVVTPFDDRIVAAEVLQTMAQENAR